MKRIVFLLLFLSLNLCWVAAGHAHNYDLNQRQSVSLAGLIEDMQQAQVVFIGEVHDQRGHHQAQLQLIEEMHRNGVEIGIALEMFRQDGQSTLDQWVAGELSENEFVATFQQHWQLWPLYREIFRYARQEHIPLIGLNISREIVSQVAQHGFASLPEAERRKLPLATCNVSPQYREFIRRALNGHDISGAGFEHFCEAQILWDASMAEQLDRSLQEQPQRILIVLAGNGHSWKHGIPGQLARRGDYRVRVLLPEVPGRVDWSHIGATDADYLLLGTDQAPLH